MNSATVIPLSDILSVCIFSGMAFLPEESDYGLNQFHVAKDIISKVARAEEAKAQAAYMMSVLRGQFNSLSFMGLAKPQ